MKESIKIQVFISKSAKNTQKIGQELAIKICSGASGSRKGALVICLSGDLGAGKTNFTKGFAKGLGIKEAVASPTYVIIKNYGIKNKEYREAGFKNFFHVDAYRIHSQKEMETIGFLRALLDPLNVVVIEWVENILRAVPKGAIMVEFEHMKRSSRKITISRL